MLTEAEGLADFGLWQDAWDALEAAPAEMRSQPADLRVRLRCCPGPGAWEIGEHLAGVLRDGTEADREAAARFYHALAVFHARSGMEEGAKDAIKAAASAWPDIREAMLDDPALENSLLGRGWVKLLPMIERIVSGGQTGADIAALDIALRHDLPHGGWCPKGRKSGAGRRPDQYQLDETPAANYLQRTEWNARNTDGTVNVVRLQRQQPPTHPGLPARGGTLAKKGKSWQWLLNMTAFGCICLFLLPSDAACS